MASMRLASGSRRRRTAVAVLASGALVAAVPASVASAHSPDRGSRGGSYGHDPSGSVTTIVSGLKGPRGLATADGKLIVTETDGTFSLLKRSSSGTFTKVKLGQLTTDFSPAVDVGPDRTVWLLTGGGAKPGSATLFKWRWGSSKPTAVADIGAYQKKDPDPFDLEKKPTDSNPFGVAALADGSVLVADAGGNDLLRVSSDGKSIRTVARLKPRMVKVPTGLPKTIPGEPGEPAIKVPPAGTMVRAEAVATSITVGSDGGWYVGELRGFPATPGTSEIWRIQPGTVGATCDPANPSARSCKRFADGLTSIMDLAAGPSTRSCDHHSGDNGGDDQHSGHSDHGRGVAIYAVEMSKMSWLAVELKKPGAEIGALIKVSDWGRTQQELAAGQLKLPGGVVVDRDGVIYVAGPVLGPGSVVSVGTSDSHHR